MDNNYAVSIVGGNHRGDRHKDDFYPSPRECTTSFLAKEAEHLRGMKILEPCCGDGAMSKVFIEFGFEVDSSDIVDRGYGRVADFFQMEETDCQAIITNPPFKPSEDMIVHALEVLKVDYLALLLKSQYWHSKRRAALFEKHPPAVVYPMLWRPDFLGKGSSTMDCQWTVWRKSPFPTLYQTMPKVA